LKRNIAIHFTNTAKRKFKGWVAVAALTAVGCFLALAVAGPLAQSGSAAAAMSAIPAPTPLDKEGADALVQQLKDTLSDSIDDEDAVNSIAAKWDARILTGRTKKQLILMVFNDLKTVVTEKEKQDAVWASWSELIADADAEEPAVPMVVPPRNDPPPAQNPRPRAASFEDPTELGIAIPRVGNQWILTDDRKRSSAASEMAFFGNAYKAVKNWRQERKQYKGQGYTIYVAMEPLDPNAQGKMVGIDKAVQTVIDNGFDLPLDLRFYCTGVPGTLTQAFKRGENWAPIAYIVLGDGGSSKALSATAAGTNGFETRTIRAIHEIGHILHERQAGDGFWETGRFAPLGIAGKVSGYAMGNEKEFVAEVFTGFMIGKRWPADVVAEYRRFGGPTQVPH